MVTQVFSSSLDRDRDPALSEASLRPAAAIAMAPAQARSAGPHASPLAPPPPPSHLASACLAEPQLATGLLHSACANAPAIYNYQGHITGAVLFDSNGLPQEYFTSTQISLDNWEQLVFQLLGLRWLLMSSLKIDDFGFARASSGNHTAVLIRQRDAYLALLTESLDDKIYELEFRQWLCKFDLSILRRDTRFESF